MYTYNATKNLALFYRCVYVKTTPCVQAAPHGDGGQDALTVLSHVDEAATRIKLTKYGEFS